MLLVATGCSRVSSSAAASADQGLDLTAPGDGAADADDAGDDAGDDASTAFKALLGDGRDGELDIAGTYEVNKAFPARKVTALGADNVTLANGQGLAAGDEVALIPPVAGG